MPPWFLHIRVLGRASPQIVRLGSMTIRIGRGEACDIRIDDPTLAEVECQIRPIGETWHLQPLGRSRRVTLDGRPVEHLQVLTPNATVRVGEAAFTLSQSAGTDRFGAVEIPDSISLGRSARHFGIGDNDDRLGQYAPPNPPPKPAAAQTTERPSTRRPTPAERMWQARWRAVGRAIKASGSVANQSPIESSQAVVVPFVSPAAKAEEPRSQILAAEVPPTPPEPAATPPHEGGPNDTGHDPVSHDFEDSERPDHQHVLTIHAASSEVLSTSSELVSTEFASYITDPLDDPTTESHPVSEPPPQTTSKTQSTPPVPAAPAEPTLLTAAPRRPRARRPSERRTAKPPATPEPTAPPAPVDDPSWPSVQSLLTMSRPRPEAAREPRKPTQPKIALLTVPSPPSHWRLPTWLGALGGVAAVFVVGAVGLYLAVAWGADDREAGALADRLMTLKNTDSIAATDIDPSATWWKTTGQHLAVRAVAFGARKGDPSRGEAAQFLLEAARASAPLEPASRLARVEIGQEARDARALPALGLSRDAVALAVTARALAREKKTEPALAAYRSALNFAAQGLDAPGRPTRYLDTPDASRYALPSEAAAEAIVTEMTTQPGWKPATFAGVLSGHGLIHLAAYRVLKARGLPEAESELAALVGSVDTPEMGSPALHLAARAEGMAIQRRFAEAADLYQEAIASAPDELTRRSWHLNRALILARGGDGKTAKDAMMAARAGRGDDEIGRRVALSLVRERLVEPVASTPASTRIRAN